jgi:hypothetical protein
VISGPFCRGTLCSSLSAYINPVQPSECSPLSSSSAHDAMERLENIVKYGYTPVPRDPEVLLSGHPTAGGSSPQQADYALTELAFPDTELVRRSKAFVQKELNTPTFNHSHRVYIYGASLSRLRCCTSLWRCGCRDCAGAEAFPGMEVRRRSILPQLSLPRHWHCGPVSRNYENELRVQGRDRRARVHP